jgi:hypothetical protein
MRSEREEEARGSRIALASGTPAQLIVDASALVTLGADDVQSPRRHHLLALLGADLLVFRQHLLEASLELLGRFVELLADLVDGANVILPLCLVARVRLAEPLFERLLDRQMLLLRGVASVGGLLVFVRQRGTVTRAAAQQ